MRGFKGEDCSELDAIEELVSVTTTVKLCKFNCNNNGKCVDGTCSCENGFYGEFCE